MFEQLTVSVLLPVCGVKEEVFAMALRSVLMQSRPVNQLVIVDDSGLGAHEAVSKSVVEQSTTGCSLTYIKNAKNLGVVKSLNIGLAACDGEVVARMDADDVSMPNRIEAQLNLISRGYNLVGGNIIKFGQGELKLIRYPSSFMALLIAFMRSNPFAHPAVMYRRDVILALGGYRDVPYAEDLDLWVRCLAAGVKMVNVALPVLMYRQHSQQVSVLNQKRQMDAAKLIKGRVINALAARCRLRCLGW